MGESRPRSISISANLIIPSPCETEPYNKSSKNTGVVEWGRLTLSYGWIQICFHQQQSLHSCRGKPCFSTFRSCTIGINRFWLVRFFVFHWRKPFSVVLVSQLFQLVSNQAGTVEKASVWLCAVILAPVRTGPRSCRVSTENRWKTLLFRSVNRINSAHVAALARSHMNDLIPFERRFRYR